MRIVLPIIQNSFKKRKEGRKEGVEDGPLVMPFIDFLKAILNSKYKEERFRTLE